MTGDGCNEMQLLVQADIDGELQPANAARVAAHLAHCPDCTAAQARLMALSTRLRQDAPRYPASDRLRAAVRANLAVAPAAPRRVRTIAQGAWFGAGFAVAAALAAFLVLPAGGGLPDAVVAAHIRALQPGHLMDVVSTDQHTVKPWFDGKLPFAPPVKELAQAGFPLTGGRLDYLDGRTAAVLVYRSGQHLIDLFTWPDAGATEAIPASGSRDGYNFRRWRSGGMAFWAVSDLNPEELDAFVAKWQAG